MDLIYSIVISLIIVSSGIFLYRFLIGRKKHSKDYPEAETKNKEIISPKFARYDYVFSNGIKCFQEELSYNQDKRLAELIASLNINDFTELKIEDIIKLLTEHEVLENFFEIIFHVNARPSNATFSQLKNSEIERALTDFFTLNPAAKRLLQILNVASVFTKQDLKTIKETP